MRNLTRVWRGAEHPYCHGNESNLKSSPSDALYYDERKEGVMTKNGSMFLSNCQESARRCNRVANSALPVKHIFRKNLKQPENHGKNSVLH